MHLVSRHKASVYMYITVLMTMVSLYTPMWERYSSGFT